MDDYNNWANECGANADSVTKKMFEALVGEEEVHLDQYETEIDNLENTGTITWRCNPSSVAKASLRKWRLRCRRIVCVVDICCEEESTAGFLFAVLAFK